MAKRVIDEFRVKRSGFLARWRPIRILTDENGLIYTEDVPGEETINLDRISDYDKNDRRYNPGDIIQQPTCNFSTHARYTIRATDERPFAVTTDELNVPACGYEEPLPEPAVPFNPFGVPNYGLYKVFSFCDNEYQPCEIEFEKKGYSGAVNYFEHAEANPIRKSFLEVDTKDEPIRATEVSLSFINMVDFEAEEFYTEDERSFRVTIRKNGVIDFRGYVIPDSCREDFTTAPNRVEIKVTDALGSLKTVTYPTPIGQTFDLEQSFIDIICYCLAPLNLNLDIATICNLYATGMPTALGDDPLDMAKVNPLVFVNEKGNMTSYEVLSAVCRGWGAYIVQEKGAWQIVRFNEMANPIIRQRTYNYKGLRLFANNVVNSRIIGRALK